MKKKIGGGGAKGTRSLSSSFYCNSSSLPEHSWCRKKEQHRVCALVELVAQTNVKGKEARTCSATGEFRSSEPEKKATCHNSNFFFSLHSSPFPLSLSLSLSRARFLGLSLSVALSCMDLRVDNGGAEPPPPSSGSGEGTSADASAASPAPVQSMRYGNNPTPSLTPSGMFSSAFAGSASRGPWKGANRTAAAAAAVAAENKNNRRLASIFSGDAHPDEKGINGNGGNVGDGNPSSQQQKRSLRKRRSGKRRSPWLSAPMILGSEVASNIA